MRAPEIIGFSLRVTASSLAATRFCSSTVTSPYTAPTVVADARAALESALGALAEYGLLLLSDPALPSVTGVIVSEPLRGSWWGHPQGGVIYHVSVALEDHPDVLCAKLVAGKVTFVHRRLWPAVCAVGGAREDWQLAGLSAQAQWLLAGTDAAGKVQTNDLISARRKELPKSGRELERRLLVHATEIHTSSGAHAKVLETWRHWAERTGFLTNPVSVSDAKRDLEDAVNRLTEGTGAVAARLVPWPPS